MVWAAKLCKLCNPNNSYANNFEAQGRFQMSRLNNRNLSFVGK